LSLQLVAYSWLRKRKDLNFWERERERERDTKQRHKQSWKTQGFCFCNYYSWLRKSKDFDFWKRERDKQSWKSQGFFFLQLLLIVEKQSGMYFSHSPYFLSEIWAFCHILHLILWILLNKSFCNNKNNWSWALGTLPRI
jgi:hypothetical protein